MSNYAQGQVLAIRYDVWISGTKLELAKKQCIDSIEIKETVEGSDVATITIYDPEFLYLEDNLFTEDNSIKIELGWDNTTYKATFNGYISAIDVDFASNGIPLITITCMDETHRMNRQKNSNTFTNCTSASVVDRIVKNYGFNSVIDSNYEFPVQETITQSHQTDIDFITKLAGQEVYPFTARLIGNTFYYVKMGNYTTPKMTLTYRTYPHEIISFNPRVNKETKQIEIKNSSVDAESKSVSTTTGTTGKKKKKGNSSSKGRKNKKTTYRSNKNKKSGTSSKQNNTTNKKTGSTTPSSNNSRKNKNTYKYDPNTKKWVKR